MSCGVSFDELMALLDGEVPEDRASELLEHLRTCPSCRAVLDSQQGLETAWRESFRDPEPSRFREMEERIAWRLASTRPKRRRWALVLPAAAAAAAVLLGVRLILLEGPSLPGLTTSREVEQAETQELEAGSRAEPAEVCETEEEQPPLPGAQDGLAGEASPAQPSPDRFGETSDLETLSGLLGAVDDLTLHASPESPDAGAAGATGSEAPAGGVEGIAQENLETEGYRLFGGAGGGGTGDIQSTLGHGLGGSVAEETVCLSLDTGTSTDTSPVTSSSTMPSEAVGVSGAWEQESIDVDDHADVPGRAQESDGDETGGTLATAVVGGGSAGLPASTVPVTLVIDPSGMPDSATALLLDSLLPDWAGYIPFAFRDTVLIAAPGEVRSILTEASPQEGAE